LKIERHFASVNVGLKLCNRVIGLGLGIQNRFSFPIIDGVNGADGYDVQQNGQTQIRDQGQRVTLSSHIDRNP
jgi:hypothetical protein